MKEYQIIAKVHGFYTYEDPKCPSAWKGSGCYDIDVKCFIIIEATVFADSEQRAREMVEGFDYGNDSRNPYIICVEEVEILSVVWCETDVADEESIEVEYYESDDLLAEP